MISPADNRENHPTVKLFRQEWPIPELAPRQLRQIRSSLLEFNQLIGKTRGADEQQSAPGKQTFVELCVTLTDDDYERLLLRPIYYGLTRAHPDLKWEDFLDLPITDMEAIAAWFVVRRQSGLFVFEQEGGERATGEAPAA